MNESIGLVVIALVGIIAIACIAITFIKVMISTTKKSQQRNNKD
ncbi:hypothetical protein [Clostridium sp. UBA1353]